MDWFANGLLREGRHADHPRAGDMVRRDVPTCRLHDSVPDIAARMRATRWDLCAVFNQEQVLLGLLHPDPLRGEACTPAEHVMQSAPTTSRAHLTLEQLGTRVKKRDHLAVLK